MPAASLERSESRITAIAPFVAPDKERDSRDRLAVDLAGDWGSSVAQTEDAPLEPLLERKFVFGPPSFQASLEIPVTEELILSDEERKISDRILDQMRGSRITTSDSSEI